MKPTFLVVSIALAFGTLAGCDQNPTASQPAKTETTAPAGTGSSSATVTTPTTPANIGTPSKAETSPREQPPVQGREDVRQPEQRRDFQMKGDGAGPKPGG